MPIHIPIQSVPHILLNEPRRWDNDTILANFSARDAAVIIELPLSQSFQEDVLFWHPESKGSFSIKSAYRLAWKAHIQVKIQSQALGYHAFPRMQALASWWKCMWKLNIMLRTRVFPWRVGRNALPTKDRQASKGIIIDGGSYLCGHHQESICHLFFDCPYMIHALHAALPGCILPFVND